MAIYGGNIAGFFWNGGTILQFFFGVAVSSPVQIVSSFFNIASPASYLMFGHKNLGVVAGGLLGIIGTFLAVYPQIMAGEISSIFGFAAFCLFVSLGIFSAPVTRRFIHDRNTVLRWTLGHPRRTDGLGIFFCTRVPIICESLTHNRLHLAAVFALWGLGDLAFSFSKADIGPNPLLQD